MSAHHCRADLISVRGLVATYAFTPDYIVEPFRCGTMEVNLDAGTFKIVECSDATRGDEIRCARLVQKIIEEHAATGAPPKVAFYIA